MRYPIAIHKDPKSDFGVTVPDLPGCFSAGSTVDEAIEMAREATLLHLEGLLEEGGEVPAPGDIESHRKNKMFAGAVWAFVEVDLTEVTRARRVNVTLPVKLLDAIDRETRGTGETRSGLLAKAAARYLNAATPKSRKR